MEKAGTIPNPCSHLLLLLSLLLIIMMIMVIILLTVIVLLSVWLRGRCVCCRFRTTWNTGVSTSFTSRHVVNITITSSKRPSTRNCVKKPRVLFSPTMKNSNNSSSSSSSREKPRRPQMQEAAIPGGSNVPGTYLKNHKHQRLLGYAVWCRSLSAEYNFCFYHTRVRRGNAFDRVCLCACLSVQFVLRLLTALI